MHSRVDGLSVGESLFFVSKVPFIADLFRSNFFWKAPFFAIFANNKAPFFRRISLREKKNFFKIFFSKKSRKIGSTQLTAQNWTIFRRISQREKNNFSPFFTSRKSAIFRFAKNAIFAAFCSAKKSAIFAKNFTKSRLDPSVHTPLWAPGDDFGQREKKTKSGRISDRKMTAARDPWVAGR